MPGLEPVTYRLLRRIIQLLCTNYSSITPQSAQAYILERKYVVRGGGEIKKF